MMYALLLHIAAPLQSWGTDSLFQERGAGSAPSMSAICGMVCAAAGADKGSEDEERIIAGFRAARMHCAARGDGPSRAPLCDFHTVLGTRAVNGAPLPTVVTRRFYQQDERYCVLLESADRDFLQRSAGALRNPRRGIWLGRKCCIPAEPPVREPVMPAAEARRLLLNGPRRIRELWWQLDDTAGADLLLRDRPLSFGLPGNSGRAGRACDYRPLRRITDPAAIAALLTE